MTTQHTPGPWGWYDASGPLKDEADVSIVASRLADLSPVPITIMGGTRSGEVRVSNEANARLIAAAPSLLELLMEIARDDSDVSAPEAWADPAAGGIEWLRRAQTAIAATTGKKE